MKQYKYPSVLTIAGSDSGGGAGIQADLKTFSALGCYGTSAITGITVQNTLGVTGIHNIPPAIVAGQIRAVMDDIKPAAIKIGMVNSVDLIRSIGVVLKDYQGVPVILDPVMVATSGDRLIQDEAIAVLQETLFPLAILVTPNLDETSILTGSPISNIDQMKTAAADILKTGCHAVLVKGGHLPGKTLYNFYLDKSGNAELFSSEALATNNTHGTGCTLSSAIAAYLALQFPLAEAISKACYYIHTAIEQGRDVKTGQGNGPLNHFFNPIALIKHELE